VEVLQTSTGASFLGNVSQARGHVRIAPHEVRTFSLGRLWRETKNGSPLNAFRNNYSQSDVMQEIRAKVRKYKDLRIAVRNYPSFNIGGGNFDIDFVVRGPELEKLAAYTDQLRLKTRELGGIVDADTTLKLDSPELRVEIDRARAADLGVDAQDIGTALRLMVGGETEVSRYYDPSTNEEYDVQLRLTEEDRSDPATLTRLYLAGRAQDGRRAELIQLGNVVKTETVRTAGRIDRTDRQRSANVRAGVAPGYALGDRLEALQQAADEMNMDPGYTTMVAGRGRELNRTYGQFVWAFVLSIVFMYMILASQFESLLHPLTILLSLPLAVPFALASLWAVGGTLNLYSALGILVLFGVVKKNSILQIDHMNGLRAKGLPRLQAIMEGNRDRLRPILMTTLALVAGMLPLAVGTGPGAEERHAVAVVVIGGQTLSLLLTLLVTPVAYSLFDDFAAALRRWRGKEAEAARAAEEEAWDEEPAEPTPAAARRPNPAPAA
jgi:HAE1 family hydrophobic/amphiphilic exporter-1